MSDSEEEIVEEVVEEPVEDEESVATSEGDVDDADIMGEESDGEEVVDEEELEAAPEVDTYERTKNQTHKTVIIVDPKKRKTSNMINKAELVEAIGIRAQQISQRATVFVDINRKDKTMVDDPILIAKMEIAQRRCPLVLRRVIKSISNRKTGHVTEWVEDFPVNEMIYPFSFKLQ